MGIKGWTDREYVEAALDMLPEDVEEVGRFLRRQGVRESKVEMRAVCATCPIAQWVNKWTDREAYVGYNIVSSDRRWSTWQLTLPHSAKQFIRRWDYDHTLA